VGRHERLLQRVLSGRSDANVRFSDLRALMAHLGFDERMKGSHHIFNKEGIMELVNLQDCRGQAKPEQVRQIRRLIRQYGLGGRS